MPDTNRPIVVRDSVIITKPPVEIAEGDYEEDLGSPTEKLSQKTFEATRKLIVPWSQRFVVARKILGTTTIDALGQTVHVRAQSYPHFRRCYAQDIDMSPWFPEGDGSTHDSVSNALQYATAMLTVRYSTEEMQGNGNDEDEEEEPVTYATERVEPFTEFVTLPPGRNIYWNFADKQLVKDSEAPGKPIRGLNWVYKIMRMPRIPQAVIDLADTINEHQITSATLGLTFPAKTLLYKPPVLEREITSDGFQAWNLEFKFSYRKHTWEKFNRPGYQLPQYMYDSDGEIFHPFEFGDFRRIVSGIPAEDEPDE